MKTSLIRRWAFGLLVLVLLGGCELFSPPDTQNPTIIFLSPSPGESISGRYTVKMNPGDDQGVFKIDLDMDSRTTLATLKGPPWEYVLNTGDFPLGNHQLVAGVFDLSGNMVRKTLAMTTVPAQGITGEVLKVDFTPYPTMDIGAGDYSTWLKPPLNHYRQGLGILRVEKAPGTVQEAAKAVHMVDTQTKGEYVGITARFLAIPAGQISFDLYLEGRTALDIQLLREPPDTDPILAVNAMVGEDTAGSFLVIRGVRKSLEEKIWHNIRVAFDCTAKTYQLSIDGVDVRIPEPFLAGAETVSYINMLALVTSSADQDSFGGIMMHGNCFVRNLQGTTDILPGQTYAYLAAPGSFTATQNQNSQITLSWNSRSGTAKYLLYRANTLEGPYTYLTGVSPAAGTANEVTLTSTVPASNPIIPGKTYWFKILAVDAQGIPGDFSPPAQGTSLVRNYPDYIITQTSSSWSTAINLPRTTVTRTVNSPSGVVSYNSTYTENMVVKSVVNRTGTAPEAALETLWQFVIDHGLKTNVEYDPQALIRTGGGSTGSVTIQAEGFTWTLNTTSPVSLGTEIAELVSRITTLETTYAH